MNVSARSEQDWGIALLTALSVLAILLSAVARPPAAYAYNEYVGDGGDTQTRNDGGAFMGGAAALGTSGTAMIAAGKFTGSTAFAYGGATIATGGAGFALFGGGLLA